MIRQRVDSPNVGVVLFSKKVEIITLMTTDLGVAVAAVEGMKWPRLTTATSDALKLAMQVFQRSGRFEVSKENTIGILLTEGAPNDLSATKTAAGTRRPCPPASLTPVPH